MSEYKNEFTYKQRFEYIVYLKNTLYLILKLTHKEINHFEKITISLDACLLFSPKLKVQTFIYDNGVQKAISNLLTKSDSCHTSHNS